MRALECRTARTGGARQPIREPYLVGAQTFTSRASLPLRHPPCARCGVRVDPVSFAPAAQ
ncbi:hypothetical protein P355_2662 [Burkholderia cenocepacia KC-01]|nr:hypothetical protein P355_2662 [Burkholderia cenocepacia KC-01]